MELKPCDNPDCDHRTSLASAYCCGACSLAHEKHYEIHEDGSFLGHTAGCLARHAERGPSAAWERGA